MPANPSFNIRVYGLWLHQGRMLVNEELIRGQQVIKFPGGGLEFGEGLIDGLKREWKEELDLDIEVLDHFYTTDFFQPSAYDNSQVISVYYWVTAWDAPETIVNLVNGERTWWMDMSNVSEDAFTLPIDRRVAGMLQVLYLNNGI